MEEYKFSYKPIPDLVSIIIPTHNRANYIVETLESIEKQQYDKVEVIVVDDNSTDNTNDVVSKFSKNSRFPIRYLFSDGVGSNHARNIGLINSKGSYIQFFDDDDLVSEDFFTTRIELMKSGVYDFSTCNFIIFLGDINNIVGHKTISGIPHTIYSHLYHYALPTPCFLFSRSAIEHIGFWNESVLRLQDMSYYHRVFKEGLKGLWLDRSLYLARKHDHCITKRVGNDKMIYAWAAICREWKNVDQSKDVQTLCVERMWDLASFSRFDGHFIKWMKYIMFIFKESPRLFFTLLVAKTRNRIVR